VARAQTAIQAHYAAGQIWVVWDLGSTRPETFVIFGSDTAMTRLADGQQVGRLFEYEYLPGALREQFAAPELAWVIPSEGGAELDTLNSDQALFVETVHAAGPRYYAVVAHGDSTVIPGVNATTAPAEGLYDPSETVECHLQMEQSPLEGYLSWVYAMWADGREDPEDRRPDIPVCANAAKNGMPSIFIVSARDDLGPGRHPVSYWLHGGGGTAIQSLPGKRPYYTIDPDQGLLVAHNDDLIRWIESELQILEEHSNSWWFGWGIGHDPFPGAPELPAPGEIIVNYTQRRLVWIHKWLILQGWVDAEFASVLGHSVGSAGTTALGKAYPDLFATCTIFNNGFAGPDSSASGWNIFGRPEDQLKSVLVDAVGDSIPVFKAFDLTTTLAPGVDLPLFRSFHGKNDHNGVMGWDAFVVEQYRAADSLGLGMHLYWDERGHSPSSEPGHWAQGATPDSQTVRDNVAYQEHYSLQQSFPGFFGHAGRPATFDPGDGNSEVGDPWGTWGGYHHWELDGIVDLPDRWQATIFLIDGSPWLPDNAAMDSLVSHLTIRRAQAFRPRPGEMVSWSQVSTFGDTLDSGWVRVDVDGKVVLRDLTTYRDPERTRVSFQRSWPRRHLFSAPRP